jgi:hypothetical protein
LKFNSASTRKRAGFSNAPLVTDRAVCVLLVELIKITTQAEAQAHALEPFFYQISPHLVKISHRLPQFFYHFRP